MPIFAIPYEIEIELTHKCNWNCPYCAIQVHQLPNISYMQLMQKVKSIPNDSIVTLSGGEPGMLSYETLNRIICILKSKNCQLYLNTNGLLLRKYKDFIPEFKQIIYHCSQNLDLSDQIVKLNINNINYMLVITNDNVNKLGAFLECHKEIDKFDIIQATYDDPHNRPTLSKKNRNAVIRQFSCRMTKDSIRRMFHEKEWNIMKFM